MSYKLKVLGDLPLAYWRLEETSGTQAQDSAGFNFHGTHFSAPTLGRRGLVADSKGALFSGAQHATASLPDLMVNGNERESFALEAWVKVESPPTAKRLVAGRADTGIYLAPGGVEFSSLSTDGNTYTSYYTVTDWTEPMHIIANYVGRNLGLIVNGEEGTNADFVGGFTATTDSFYIGGTSTTSSTSILLDEVAVFRKTLSIRTATSHYYTGLISYHPSEVAQSSSGTYYALDDSSADIIFNFEEYNFEGFSNGTTTNVTVTDDYIIADNGAGTYLTDMQYIGNLGSIAGSRIDWEASSAVTVDISFDGGLTWAACTNHEEAPTLTPNKTITPQFLWLRVNFAAASGYSPLLSRVALVIYKSKSVSANVNSRVTMYGSPVLAEVAYSPLRNVTEMGINFVDYSYMTVPSPENGAASLGFWYRRNNDNPGAAWEYIIDTRTTADTTGAWFAVASNNTISVGGTKAIYVNGIAKTPVMSDFPIGVWVHVTMILVSKNVEDITVNSRYSHNEPGLHSIAHLTLYPTELTAQQAAVRYQSALGLVKYSVVDSTTASIIEVANGTRAYNHAWSIAQTVIV